MNQRPDQLYVQVVDKNFQANIDDQNKQKQNQNIGSNQFLNPDADQYNNKPSTPKQINENSEQQQQSDQQPVYKLQKALPKQNQKQRLVQQNIKLKAQIYELAKQLDQILQKDKKKKKKYGLSLIDQQDQIITDKKLQLKKQQLQIMQIKNKIFVAKRQLDAVYNNLVITQRQNHIKNLQFQLKILQKQKSGLVNMNQQQVKALKIAQNQQQYGSKVQNTKKQCHQLKIQTRKIINKIGQQQKKLKKTHQIYINKLQKLKQIQSKLALNKQKSIKIKKNNTSNNLTLITEDMIKTLQSQVKQCQKSKIQGQKSWQQKIKTIDLQLYKKRIQQQRKMLILRQKQKQLKLNELRIRQLRKLIRESETQQKQRLSKQMDMSQYRHKRNIRYLQK